METPSLLLSFISSPVSQNSSSGSLEVKQSLSNPPAAPGKSSQSRQPHVAGTEVVRQGYDSGLYLAGRHFNPLPSLYNNISATSCKIRDDGGLMWAL